MHFDDVVSVKETKEITGWSVPRIHQLIAEGKLNAMRRGNMLWLDRAEVEEFARRNKRRVLAPKAVPYAPRAERASAPVAERTEAAS